MAVDRCVCYNVTFDRLLRLHRDEGLGLDALIERTGCTKGCGTCRPYIELMLRTGETDLPVIVQNTTRATRG